MVTVPAKETAIINNPDCQRLALVSFMQTDRNQAEGSTGPASHPQQRRPGQIRLEVSTKEQARGAYNFDCSKNTNQTFDVPTSGDSANGIAGPSKIQAINANLFPTISPTEVNEFPLHFRT